VATRPINCIAFSVRRAVFGSAVRHPLLPVLRWLYLKNGPSNADELRRSAIIRCSTGLSHRRFRGILSVTDAVRRRGKRRRMLKGGTEARWRWIEQLQHKPAPG